MTINKDRMIVLDTETTGFAWENGHRIIEIGAVEVINRNVTGRTFHVYIDPEREVDEDAEKVHGWNRENLMVASDGKKFGDIAKEFLEFVQGSVIVAHNAPFDMGHIDAEFRRMGWPELTGQVMVTDTLKMANQLYPGKRNNLDMLSARLGVDTSERTLHGALLDAEILTDVFLIMTTKQNDLLVKRGNGPSVDLDDSVRPELKFKTVDPALAGKLVVAQANEQELSEHNSMMSRIESESDSSGLSF